MSFFTYLIAKTQQVHYIEKATRNIRQTLRLRFQRIEKKEQTGPEGDNHLQQTRPCRGLAKIIS